MVQKENKLVSFLFLFCCRPFEQIHSHGSGYHIFRLYAYLHPQWPSYPLVEPTPNLFPNIVKYYIFGGWKKSCTTKMIVESWNPLNSGMFTTYQLEFLPSTASFASGAAGRISACKLQFFIIVRRCSKTCPSLVKRDYLVGGLEHFSIYWEESSQLTFIFSAG